MVIISESDILEARFLRFLSDGRVEYFIFLISDENSLQKSSTITKISVILSLVNISKSLVFILKFRTLNILTFAFYTKFLINFLIPNSRLNMKTFLKTQIRIILVFFTAFGLYAQSPGSLDTSFDIGEGFYLNYGHISSLALQA